ncbi:MAG: acyl-CoA thioesterase [Ignavibacteriaceae bacterium]|jgi:acyl-CoA hydrolase|nr:acyl-CoA thioesterase [Ignavibacterium sp.]MCC6253694.1 acyl-CoA thioesterase [Ignavibacteriaceae bacterium]HMN25274.1 acyl-CoA thioesterase [Ignavibacteriaceae bacterium]HRN25409.1 acyl-CoA thioesterase [Ignavibacteriaceae bacterium]HRP91563.1 acyl-CoA thioesterase [Ignavibacteriaceae bacterium]
MQRAKKISDSQIIMTELVLPNHTNQLGNLLGGQLMHWIDICAALSAAKHNHRVCVTASVDRIDFHNPVKLGDAVTLTSSINRVFKTSMEVGVEVYAQNFRLGTRFHSNTAYLTFVSVDNDGKPVEAIDAIPESEDEIRRYNEALIRRENRLKDRNK